MKWSYKLGRLAGIDVYVHGTFALLIAFIALSGMSAGAGAALAGVVFSLLIFGCVLLHELGHALAARRYGIATRDITLLPIGGVARLERMPRNPLQEIAVALAGPAVNVAIAAVLFLLGAILPVPLLDRLLWANLVLVGFNLIPAFPMDGGRVLRALLALRRPHHKATVLTARVGKSFAVLFGLLGLVSGNFMLTVLAVFVFIAAGAEARSTAAFSALDGARAVDAALHHYGCLRAGDTLDEAVQAVLSSSQRDFPVLDRDGRLVGLLTEWDLRNALSSLGSHALVAQAMRSNIPTADPYDDLTEAVEKLQASGLRTMPLVLNERLAGLLTLDNVAEYLMLRRRFWRPA